MSTKPCKNGCGQDIEIRQIGGKWMPCDPVSGQPHKCPKSVYPPQQTPASNNSNATQTIIARLDDYGTGCATFAQKDCKHHTYAISPAREKEWENAGYQKESIWLSLTLNSAKFVQGAIPIPAPDWAVVVPPASMIKKPEPFRKASELPKAETPCTSPPVAPANEIQQKDIDEMKGEPSPETKIAAEEMTNEDRVRKAMNGIMPSDRVGYRISLAGMVNSVIETEKMSSDAPKTYAELEADVKKKALALFLWCDSLTTPNLGGA